MFHYNILDSHLHMVQAPLSIHFTHSAIEIIITLQFWRCSNILSILKNKLCSVFITGSGEEIHLFPISFKGCPFLFPYFQFKNKTFFGCTRIPMFLYMLALLWYFRAFFFIFGEDVITICHKLSIVIQFARLFFLNYKVFNMDFNDQILQFLIILFIIQTEAQKNNCCNRQKHFRNNSLIIALSSVLNQIKIFKIITIEGAVLPRTVQYIHVWATSSSQNPLFLSTFSQFSTVVPWRYTSPLPK